MPGVAPPAPVPPRILIRGLNWLGDAVMSAPALERLRARLPDAHLALLTPEKLAGLWRADRRLNEVIGFAPGETLWGVARRLRAGRFDIGLALPNSPRSALELWLAGIPRRIGVRQLWRAGLLTRAVAPDPARTPMRKRSAAEVRRLIARPELNTFHPSPAAHHSLHYLRLAAELGADPSPLEPRLELPAGASERACAIVGPAGRARPWLGLNAGAEYGPAKRWPLDRFVAAAIEIQRRTGALWLVFGVEREAGLAAQIEAGIRAGSRPDSGAAVVNLAGRTSLLELACVMRECRAVLTNDSGPMHLAAALGAPVIAPFGSTSPELTGPGLPGVGPHHILRGQAPCSPCFRRECPIDHRCMTSIPVATVVQAVLQAYHARQSRLPEASG